MWRACHNLLPTRDNLCWKKIISDPICPICGLEVETTFHILWACPSTMDMWCEGSCFFQKFIAQAPNFLQLVEGIFQKYGKEDFHIFVETTKKIWFCINRYHEGLFTPPHEIGKMASLVEEEFARCNEAKVEDDVNRDIVQTTWIRPPLGWFKINCDATVDGKNGVMGGGLIIRDRVGKPFAARSFMKRGCLDLITAKVMVVVQAARFCKETGVDNMIVEGDASTIITALQET